MSEQKLVKVEVDEASLSSATQEQENERKVAIFDLLEENHFAPVAPEGYEPVGPFSLKLLADENRLVFDITDDATGASVQHILSISPFRQVLKDYFEICKAYFQAVKELPPSQIEAIDMGRRGIHNEGARILEERLEGKVELDHDTARRLFTLISAMFRS